MNPIFEYSDTLNNPYEAFFFDAQKNNFPVSPHWHYFMELLYILKELPISKPIQTIMFWNPEI